MNRLNTFDRRMAVLKCLFLRRHDTIYNLAAEFCVADSTMRKDIDALAYSFPIYTSQGRGGGVFILEKSGKDFMTKEQTAFLEKLTKELSEEDLIVMKGIIVRFGWRE